MFLSLLDIDIIQRTTYKVSFIFDDNCIAGDDDYTYNLNTFTGYKINKIDSSKCIKINQINNRNHCNKYLTEVHYQ